ncbi:MAG: hypothetical protein GTO46_03615 [Gemmatimonadetes bacterium]|nr:hypothetical protein [Gemmatimonadota bacterium]NIO32888.1 hypothetical protein [Gemmatimonadota bacterium]
MKRLPLLHTVAAGVLWLFVGCGKPAQEATQAYAPAIDAARFVTNVDNQYFPLVPGTTFVYETPDGGERVEVIVTEETKTIMGVTCMVVMSHEFEDGELVEETADWYAQDMDGNVWYFGEDTKEYEDGEVVSTAGSWEAGVDGAQPGIIMKGAPAVGQSYRQEYYAGRAEDMGEVLALQESVTVPYGSFENLLKTKEWTPLEPGDEEHGYYAPGVGLVLEAEGDDRLELISVGAG